MRRALALLLLAAACTSGSPTARPPTPSTSPSLSASPTAAATTPPPVVRPTSSRTVSPSPAATPSCATYRPADPKRPVLTLDLDVQGRSVVGSEHLVFTPDLPVSELVFRLWAAAPVPSKYGGRAAVTSAKVNGTTQAFRRTAATVVRIPWTGVAGQAITIDLGFTLTLPVGADERWGNRGTTSWLATGHPLLAWEVGHGWDVEPPTTQFAEASTGEEMRLASLTVHHPRGLTVLATGRTVGQNATTLVTTAPAVRDVAVAVGAFRTARAPGPAPVVVGVAPGLSDSPSSIAAQAVAHLRRHAARFGPFPYEQLVVAVLPDITGGIEHPGAILLGTGQDKDATLSHELGHEWFYGLVGDDQARDPWVDEAFATFAEAVDRGTGPSYTRASAVPSSVRGQTGRPMTYWEGRKYYYRGVYVQGAGALLRARASSPRLFDAQLRCYVAHNAHRIATPADVARDLAVAVPPLRAVGAIRE